MTVLWATLLIVYIFAFLSRYIPANSAGLDYSYIKPNKFMIFIVCVCLVLVSGLRNTIGDTYFYMHAYETNDFTWKFAIENKDPGFSVLQMFLKNISNDPQLLLLITALITNVLIVITLFKYSKMIEISFYVFITSGMFIVSMNGIRQFFAASIIFWATKFLLAGQFKHYFFIVLFASTFHESALILLPIYFIVRREAWTRVTLLLLSLAILIVIGFEQFTKILFTVLGDSHYASYSEFAEGGANITRVLVDAVPIVIAFLGRDKLRELWPKSDIIVNMAIIGLLFSIIATQNWIFARFNIYFSLYNLILISWIIYLFKNNNRKLVYFSLLVCYFVYSFYEQVISLGIDYDSDFIKF